MTAELLHCQPESQRASSIFAAFAKAAPQVGMTSKHTQHYHGHSDWLMLWGPGEPRRAQAMRRHVESGRHVVALDLSYWDRDRKFRVSIDAPHPQAWVMRKQWPGSRLDVDGIKLKQGWKADGPVVVAGIGEKAGEQYGADTVRAWERQMIAEAKRRGYAVRYRPKRPTYPVPEGVTLAKHGPIDAALSGSSLVITWHSNVAVDALRLGIPVICRDGAAAAVCPSEWPDTIEPIAYDVRLRFLMNLAWFQWRVEEADSCWRFLQDVVS